MPPYLFFLLETGAATLPSAFIGSPFERTAGYSRVVVQGVKGSKAPMQLLPGLILHTESSQFTPDAEAVLRDGSTWRLR